MSAEQVQSSGWVFGGCLQGLLLREKPTSPSADAGGGGCSGLPLGVNGMIVLSRLRADRAPPSYPFPATTITVFAVVSLQPFARTGLLRRGGVVWL